MSIIPINSCLLASNKETNIIGPVNKFDKRSIAGKRRILAQIQAIKAKDMNVIAMAKKVVKSSISMKKKRLICKITS